MDQLIDISAQGDGRAVLLTADAATVAPAAVRGARAVLIGPDGEPTDVYNGYLEHRVAHLDAIQHRDHALAGLAAAGASGAWEDWPVDGRAHAERINDAYDRWRTQGHKDDVEIAMQILEAFGASSPAT